MWICGQCRESVEDGFDVCWNCQTVRPGAAAAGEGSAVDASGESGPGSGAVPGVASLPEGEPTPWAPEGERQVPADAVPPEGWCRECGSRRVIPGARILDRGSEFIPRDLSVESEGGFLSALLGGDRHPLRADVCGDCGRVELHVARPADLYAAWQGSMMRHPLDEPPPLPPVATRPAVTDSEEAAT